MPWLRNCSTPLAGKSEGYLVRVTTAQDGVQSRAHHRTEYNLTSSERVRGTTQKVRSTAVVYLSDRQCSFPTEHVRTGTLKEQCLITLRDGPGSQKIGRYIERSHSVSSRYSTVCLRAKYEYVCAPSCIWIA